MKHISRSLIISGFPGVGKTEFANRFKHTTDNPLAVIELDSRNYSKLPTGELHPDFPINYIEAIELASKSHDIILISSHDCVRELLIEKNIYHVIAFPYLGLKELYLDRYRQNGKSESEINQLNKLWRQWFDGVIRVGSCPFYILTEESSTLISIYPIILSTLSLNPSKYPLPELN